MDATIWTLNKNIYMFEAKVSHQEWFGLYTSRAIWMVIYLKAKRMRILGSWLVSKSNRCKLNSKETYKHLIAFSKSKLQYSAKPILILMSYEYMNFRYHSLFSGHWGQQNTISYIATSPWLYYWPNCFSFWEPVIQYLRWVIKTFDIWFSLHNLKDHNNNCFCQNCL